MGNFVDGFRLIDKVVVVIYRIRYRFGVYGGASLR